MQFPGQGKVVNADDVTSSFQICSREREGMPVGRTSHPPACTCDECHIKRYGRRPRPAITRQQVRDQMRLKKSTAKSVEQKPAPWQMSPPPRQVPPPPRPLPTHPTLGDIAERQEEIRHWTAEMTGAHRISGLLPSGFGGLATLFLAISLFTREAGLLCVAVTLLLITVWLITVWRADPSTNARPKPEPLTLVRFEDWENFRHMDLQQPEPFQAVSACPGCGDIKVHGFELRRPGQPQWAEVIRHCDNCGREWAQGCNNADDDDDATADEGDATTGRG